MKPDADHRPGEGVLWMIVTGMAFVAVTALVKLLGTRIPAVESAFLRYLLGLVFVVPLLGRLGGAVMDRASLRMFAWRGAAHSVAVGMWFYAMTRIPIADVTAMNYLSPIFVTVGGAIFLGEALAARRILAVGAALAGALVILRPGFREIDLGHLAMLACAVGFGVSYILGKVLSHSHKASVVVAMLSITVTIGLAPAALASWVAPTPRELAILFGVAAVATFGHYTMTRAFRAAPLAVTQPATFLQLIWAVAVGVAIFGEPVDPWVVLGGTVIVGAVSFISWREFALKRRAVTPAVAATKV